MEAGRTGRRTPQGRFKFLHFLAVQSEAGGLVFDSGASDSFADRWPFLRGGYGTLLPKLNMLAFLLLLLLTVVSAQTIHLVGDSTMALNGGGSGTQGWGVPLTQFFTLPVVNHAVAGESARSYSTEGRFTTVIAAVKSGDFVIIEVCLCIGPA